MSYQIWFVISQFKPYWKTFLLGFLASCTYGIIDGTLIWLVKPLMDKGFIGHDYHFLHKIPLYLLGIFLIRSLVTFTAHYFLAKVSVAVASHLRKNLFEDLLHYPASLYDQKSSSELISKINDQAIILSDSATNLMNLIAREGLTICVLLTVMIYASPIFTLIYLLSVPFIVNVLSYATRHSIKMQKSVFQSSEAIDHCLQEVILGQMVVKTFLGYHTEKERFARSVDENNHARLNEAKIVARSAASVQMIGGLVIALILFLAQSPFCRMSGGDFACLLTAILALLRPLKQLSSVSELFHKVVASSDALMRLKQYPKESIDLSPPLLSFQKPIPALLEFQSVHFNYPSQDDESLQKISFRVEPGQTVALVGPSGGGKSTLVSLVPRFYPYRGKILLNHVDINQIPLVELRRQIAFVAQETVLFHDTVAANIAYGCSSIDWVALRKAAQLAFAEDFINELPQGFLTKIGAGGHKLSGGERQRLALARAFYKNAPLLILDEATSALDAESEEQVQRALSSLMARSSTLVIAHRLSTIIRADQILFLDKGCILESGTHAELMEKNGAYAQLYLQSFRESHQYVSS